MMPYDDVLDFVYDNRNHFPKSTSSPRGSPSRNGSTRPAAADLPRLLEERHGVRAVRLR